MDLNKCPHPFAPSPRPKCRYRWPRPKRICVQHLYGLRNCGNMFLRSETVEGIGRQDFAVSEQAGKVIDRVTENLVAPFRRSLL
jgi:hypothetical protein